MYSEGGELVARVVFVGPEGAGRATNLCALARLAVPEPLVTRDPDARVVLAVRAPWSCEPMRLHAAVCPRGADLRRAALAGADALVFVADSAPGRFDDNVAALDALEAELARTPLGLGQRAHVIQYNKRDARCVLGVRDLRAALNRHGADEVEAAAARGRGVLTTLVLAVHAMSPRRTGAPPQPR